MNQTMSQAPAGKERLLRIDEVIGRVGIKTTSIYARIKTGDFPKGVSLGYRTVVWPESEIDAWVAAQIERARASNG